MTKPDSYFAILEKKTNSIPLATQEGWSSRAIYNPPVRLKGLSQRWVSPQFCINRSNECFMK
ncbi:MAG: hypothetical protein CMM07_22460 [Rhodopirellula sp.]|nr:hypothetical protein [Rhodopirellula sp.]